MQHSELNKEYWDEIGGSYTHVWEPLAKRIQSDHELAYIRSMVEQYHPRSILDVGCGTGRIIQEYLASPSPSDVYGIDISDSMVQHCRARFQGEVRVRHIEQGEIGKTLLFTNRKFDMISAIRVLKYNAHWKEMINIFSRHLAPNGILICTMPNIHSITGLRPDTFSSSKLPIQYTTPMKFRTTLNEAGLSILDMRGFSKLPEILYTHTTTNYEAIFLEQTERFLRTILGPLVGARIMFSTSQKDA